MLEVTIAKVYHSESTVDSTNESSKLFSYIPECDVFSHEFAFYTEEKAKQVEDFWEEQLPNRFTRQELIDNWRRINVDISPEIVAYVSEIRIKAYNMRKPFWISERFFSEEADFLKIRQKNLDDKMIEIYELPNEQEELVFQLVYDDLMEQLFIIDQVDRHIAKNLDTAESYLRKRYGIHADPLKLLLVLGLLHQPEVYTSIKCNVIDLIPDSFKPEIQIMESIRIAKGAGKDNNEVKELLRALLLSTP